jgi:hypothetical protein
VLSRNAKRIASRSQIRIHKPASKGLQQRCANPVNIGIDTWSGTAEERPDQIGIEVRHGTRLANRVEQLMAIPGAERVMNRVETGIWVRLDMGDKARMDSAVTTRLIYRVGIPMTTQMQKRVDMPMSKRMTKQVTSHIGKRLGK